MAEESGYKMITSGMFWFTLPDFSDCIQQPQKVVQLNGKLLLFSAQHAVGKKTKEEEGYITLGNFIPTVSTDNEQNG